MADRTARRAVFRAGVAIAAAMLAATGAAAQDAHKAPFGDLSGSSHDTSPRDTRVDQIAPIAEDDGDAAPAPVQVTDADADGEPVSQLSDADKSAAPAPQLSHGAPSAAAPAALSSRKEGRPEGVTHLEGDDRCDPVSGEARDKAVCAAPIETRAAEFKRPDPNRLTPEQRLLIAQRASEPAMATETAIKRIGRNDVDADAAAAQNLASLVLAPPAEPPPEKPKPDDVPTDTPAADIIQAIIQSQVP